jgi:hypothetical protein
MTKICVVVEMPRIYHTRTWHCCIREYKRSIGYLVMVSIAVNCVSGDLGVPLSEVPHAKGGRWGGR